MGLAAVSKIIAGVGSEKREILRFLNLSTSTFEGSPTYCHILAFLQTHGWIDGQMGGWMDRERDRDGDGDRDRDKER